MTAATYTAEQIEARYQQRMAEMAASCPHMAPKDYALNVRWWAEGETAYQPRRNGSAHSTPDAGTQTSGPDDGGRVSILHGDTITPEPIRWTWRDWLARGKLHVLAGTAGTGKTTLALALAATITTGGRWPDGTRAEAGDALIWSGEDDPADTLVPRLLAMGANLARVHFVGSVNDARGLRAFDPAADVPLLSARFADCGNVALLIVDPIVSAVSGDSHKNTEVRRNLQPLVDLAALRDCALIGITHYSKGTAGRDPLERVTGSLAFGALARIVLGTAKPTEAGEPRRLVRAKSNIGPDGAGFEYDLEQVEVPARPGLFASRVLWGSAIEGTARDLLAAVETEPDEAGSETDDAAAWLRDRLTGAAVPVVDLKKEAERNGFGWRTVQRARTRAGAVYRREGFGKGSSVIWELDPGEPDKAPYATTNAIRAEQDSLASMGKRGAYGGTDTGSEAQRGARDWRVTRASGDSFTVCRTPPATAAEMIEQYPGAAVAPIREAGA